MRTYITPVQLFFLVFSYLLSGFFLFHIHSYYAVAAQFAVFSLFAILASGGLSRRTSGLSDFVSSYISGMGGVIAVGLFLVLSVFQMVRTAVFYGESIGRYCDFLPWWMIFSVLCLCAVFAVRQGMTAIGRFAELIPFILVPLVFVRPFGDFAPTLAAVDFHVSGVLSCVSAAPVFFLASKTVTPGDDGVSAAMRVSSAPPAHRASYLLRVMLAAAAAASLLYVFLTLFTFRAGDVFLSFFLWLLHFLRLAVLVGIYADLIAENPNPKIRTAYTAVFAVSVVAVLAASQNVEWIRRYRIDTAVLAADFLLPVVLNVASTVRAWYVSRTGKREKRDSA